MGREWLTERLGGAEYGMHERLPNALSSLSGINAGRHESQRRRGFHLAPCGRHVPDNIAVLAESDE